MKKKIIIIFIVVIIVLCILAPRGFKIYKDYLHNKRYQEIKDDIQVDIERVLHIIYPHCQVDKSQYGILFEAEQNDYYGVDKKKLLDIDGKSYCKVRAKAKCISDGRFEWDTYIKCKDYEDEGYNIEK